PVVDEVGAGHHAVDARVGGVGRGDGQGLFEDAFTPVPLNPHLAGAGLDLHAGGVGVDLQLVGALAVDGCGAAGDHAVVARVAHHLAPLDLGHVGTGPGIEGGE